MHENAIQSQQGVDDAQESRDAGNEPLPGAKKLHFPKPSNWLPPGGLVERSRAQKRSLNLAQQKLSTRNPDCKHGFRAVNRQPWFPHDRLVYTAWPNDRLLHIGAQPSTRLPPGGLVERFTRLKKCDSLRKASGNLRSNPISQKSKEKIQQQKNVGFFNSNFILKKCFHKYLK